MTISQAIQKAIDGGERDYMRRPQSWLRVASDESLTSMVSKGMVYFVRISPKDFSLVGKYRWYLKDGYAATSIKGKRVKMHHLIVGKPPTGKEVDHINRDRLDNRRENLRFVSSLENGQNTTAIGVRKRGSRWEANVCLNYQKQFKSFRTKQEAEQWRKEIKENFTKNL